MNDHGGERTALVQVCQRLQVSGLVAATDGNVSCRVGSERFLVTPSGKSKGELLPLDMLLVDLQGEVLQGRSRPSSEIRMHTLIYARRPDIRAIVHAHPPMLTAFTLASIPFMAEALPEVYLSFGSVPTAPYATPTTDEVPRSIEALVADHQAILLERHGAVTMGATPHDALLRLEKLEHAAHTLFYAHLLSHGALQPLPKDLLGKLDALFY
ncbi:MAG: class II aldolase/adducin family protein [Syntrophobacteraceae bacterium]|jgi:L-fuculose-phosphate aldolase|nr:class II aldolase/adducin family protein [Syntrophobacteraceae bacterium]